MWSAARKKILPATTLLEGENDMLQLAFKEKRRKPVELNRSRITIGRDKSNSMVLKDEGISGFHAEIHIDEGNIFIMDLSSTNGTSVNGKKISSRIPVNIWDVIEFDKVKMEIIDPNKRRPTVERKSVTKDAMENAWALQGISGNMSGKNFSINKTMVVGRENCDIIIDDAMISSRHSKLELDDQILSVKDLGSTNGTFVNGKQITETVLKAGDEIKFDKMAFTVIGPGRSSAKTAVRSALNLAKTQVRNAATAAKTQIKPAADHCTPSQALLEVVKGHNSQQIFELRGNSLTIGRLSENDIVLTDEMVSGSHAQLTYSNGNWTIEDNGSANGITINNTNVSRKVLKPGDLLNIGQVELCFKDPQFKETMASTKVMSPSMSYEPEEEVPAPSKKIPVWIYGVVGFCIAGGALAVLLL
jgi:pSer/pThr/pTyr-binding forkhead associated (FHA) protein